MAANLFDFVGRRETAARIRESARFDRALRLAASRYVAGRDYSEFTRQAATRLEGLDRDAMALILAMVAYDAKETIAAVVALFHKGSYEDAWTEWGSLKIRIRAGTAYDTLGLSQHPRPALHDLAEPLELGLGTELRELLRQTTPIPVQLAVSWLETYGQPLDRFGDHVARRRRYALPPRGVADR